MTSFAQNGLLLDVQHVTMRFGGITAVNDLSMQIPTGSITGLIGPNGAGKTTAFNVISGFYNPQEGDILFKGHSVKGFPPHRICRAGMARTFQNIRLFGSETALENVMVGCQVRRKSQWWMPILSLPNARREEEEIREKAKALIHRLALDSYINEKAFLSAAITAAIENNTGDEAGPFHLVLKFAGDIAGKILSAAGIGVIFIHIRPKITVKRALGLFIGRLIEITGIRFAQQHNLKCVDHR